MRECADCGAIRDDTGCCLVCFSDICELCKDNHPCDGSDLTLSEIQGRVLKVEMAALMERVKPE